MDDVVKDMLAQEDAKFLHAVAAPTEAGVAGPPRVRRDGQSIYVGPTRFAADALNSWGIWAGVEAACRRLDPPVTQAELLFLGTIPNATGGRSGFEETRQALTKTHRVG